MPLLRVQSFANPCYAYQLAEGSTISASEAIGYAFDFYRVIRKALNLLFPSKKGDEIKETLAEIDKLSRDLNRRAGERLPLKEIVEVFHGILSRHKLRMGDSLSEPKIAASWSQEGIDLGVTQLFDHLIQKHGANTEGLITVCKSRRPAVVASWVRREEGLLALNSIELLPPDSRKESFWKRAELSGDAKPECHTTGRGPMRRFE